MPKTLLLTRKETLDLLDLREAISLVEKAFAIHSSGQAQVPPKVFLQFPEGDLRAMPAYYPDWGASVKVVNAHPDNPHKYHLPSVMALLIYVDPETGFPLGIMESATLTTYRTGAAAAVSAKYLARPNTHVLGFIGAGVQARTSLRALQEVIPIKRVIVWSKDTDLAEGFAQEFRDQGFSLEIASSPKTVAQQAEILVTATPSRKPLVEAEWVQPGTHIIALGADAPGKQELASELTARTKIIVDSRESACYGGEINVPLSQGIISRDHIWAEIGEILLGQKTGRENSQEITLFDSTGLAIQDLALAQHLYRKAKEKGIGEEMEFIG